MGFIYKIINDVNDKVYIGQTIRKIEQRFKQHLYDSQKEDTALYRAMRKYGTDKFHASLVEEVEDSLLNEREIYWISYFNSYKKGYNSTFGGGQGLKLDYELIRKLWDEGKSSHEICNIIGCEKGSVRAVLQIQETYSVQESLKRGQKDSCKKVAQYNLEGELIRTFNKLIDAGFFHWK